MKKGFTLVEILAVITILGVLMVLVIPSVIKTMDSSKQKAYDLVMMTFETATQEYVSDNRNNIAELRVIGTYYDITLQTLGDGGYIDLPVVNPKTNENFDPLTTIISVAKQADGTFAYKVG